MKSVYLALAASVLSVPAPVNVYITDLQWDSENFTLSVTHDCGEVKEVVCFRNYTFLPNTTVTQTLFETVTLEPETFTETWHSTLTEQFTLTETETSELTLTETETSELTLTETETSQLTLTETETSELTLTETLECTSVLNSEFSTSTPETTTATRDISIPDFTETTTSEEDCTPSTTTTTATTTATRDVSILNTGYGYYSQFSTETRDIELPETSFSPTPFETEC